MYHNSNIYPAAYKPYAQNLEIESESERESDNVCEMHDFTIHVWYAAENYHFISFSNQAPRNIIQTVIW